MTVSAPYAARRIALECSSTAPLTRLADVLLWVDEVEDGHWQWGQAHRRSDGYAAVRIGGRTEPLHRYLYEALVEPLPDGTEPDHTCPFTWCIFPGHLEPVTHAVNMARYSARRPACLRGHPYAVYGYRQPSTGWWRCLACHDEGHW